MLFQYIDCVILDDGGFLVMSNQDEYMSQVGLSILSTHTSIS